MLFQCGLLFTHRNNERWVKCHTGLLFDDFLHVCIKNTELDDFEMLKTNYAVLINNLLWLKSINDTKVATHHVYIDNYAPIRC